MDYQKNGRCLPCTLLGRWQHGPLYWLLCRHLDRMRRD